MAFFQEINQRTLLHKNHFTGVFRTIVCLSLVPVNSPKVRKIYPSLAFLSLTFQEMVVERHVTKINPLMSQRVQALLTSH